MSTNLSPPPAPGAFRASDGRPDFRWRPPPGGTVENPVEKAQFASPRISKPMLERILHTVGARPDLLKTDRLRTPFNGVERRLGRRIARPECDRRNRLLRGPRPVGISGRRAPQSPCSRVFQVRVAADGPREGVSGIGPAAGESRSVFVK